jgi:hypothetical protein
MGETLLLGEEYRRGELLKLSSFSYRSFKVKSLASPCKWYNGPHLVDPSKMRGMLPMDSPLRPETVFLGTTVVYLREECQSVNRSFLIRLL